MCLLSKKEQLAKAGRIINSCLNPEQSSIKGFSVE